MGSSTRTRRCATLLSAGTATALAVALAAAPLTPANGSAVGAPVAPVAADGSGFRASPAAPSVSVVTLLTGDRVVVRHDAHGRTTASLAPGSPHYGHPVEYLNTGTHTYVVPRLARSVRSRLDNSLFDVAALARAGRVRLDVTFAGGTAPRSLPGIDVRTSSARSATGGRTTATATYDARRPLPASFASSLRGVSRISVAGVAPQADPAYELHTLTINGETPKGRPLPGSDVFVFNADDARLFSTFGGIVDGQWRVSVPTGHSVVIVSDFDHVVLRQVAVTGDTVTDLSMGDATVKPKLTAMKGLTQLSPSLDLIGEDRAGTGGFDFGWSGFLPKVAPLAGMAAGRLHTEIAGLWTKKGYQPVTFHGGQLRFHPIKRVVATKEVERGIPHHLAFRYHPRDFAHVAINHYATGPRQRAFDSWAGISPIDTFLFVESFPSVRPGVIAASFLARRTLAWNSATTVSDSFRSFTELDQTQRYHRGQHASVPFFRGPVAPVADRGGESGRVSYSCQLCVIKGALGGTMAMFASAGTDQFGIDDHGHFDVYRGHRRLSGGSGFLAPYVGKVKAGQRLRIEVTTTPAAKKYVLSRHVSDTFGFTVPKGGRAIVPLLRAAYVPPTDLHGVGRAGHVSYPISFDNLGPIDARVSHAAMGWSVDGRHWHRAALERRDGNTFRVSYRNPAASKAHPYLSLRVRARDRAGRTVSETVQNAYVLPHSAARATTPPAVQHRGGFRPGKLCRTSGARAYSCFVKLNAATRAVGKASPDPAGWGAPALRNAYDITGDVQNPDTVAVIVAYDYPSAEADMNRYRAQYGLPLCTSASGCFTKINQKGETDHYPQPDQGWGVEAALDLQMISAACPTCHIVLAEASSPYDQPLFKAEQAAVDAGATVTNHSFGRIELTGAEADGQHYDHDGVTAVASTGDAGYQPAGFPASVPSVVAVGGTVLSRSSTAPRGWTEKAWRYGGSGCSAYYGKVDGQQDTACHMRTISDVSAVARGLAIYDTSLPRRYRGWLEVDGTSASSPLVAGMIGSRGAGGIRPSDLYADPGAFNDVTRGSNGFCKGSYLCTGLPGYDGPTGLGTPASPSAFDPVG
jgi:hypothetical protein